LDFKTTANDGVGEAIRRLSLYAEAVVDLLVPFGEPNDLMGLGQLRVIERSVWLAKVSTHEGGWES
jgi:hypothetical protein